MPDYIDQLTVISVKLKSGAFANFFIDKNNSHEYCKALHCAFITHKDGTLVKENPVRSNPQSFRGNLKRRLRRGRYEERLAPPGVAQKMKNQLREKLEKQESCGQRA
jgi:hypothetical protein